MVRGMAEEVATLESELARLREENARLVAEVERLSRALAEALERIRVV
jgi:cell division protein FtsB